MKIREVVWDDWNEEHIVRHGVEVEEVEEVLAGIFTLPLKQKKNKSTESTPRAKRSVPTFATKEEEAEFWQQHGSEDFAWEELSEPLEIDETFQERVRQRSTRKRPLQPEQAIRR